jgi:putative acetyltransferase
MNTETAGSGLMEGITIRSERRADYGQITRINNAAFGQPNEGKLIEALRKTASFDAGLSLIASSEEKIVGHILFYPIAIQASSGEYPSLSLAPMSVLPEYQNRGIGSKLVWEGLQTAKDRGYRSVIVLGHPGFYPRFGFQRAGKWQIKSPFDAPDEAFMARELIPGAFKDIHGTVKYPKEFNDV